MHKKSFAFFLACLLALSSCSVKEEKEFQRVSFRSLTGWQEEDFKSLYQTLALACKSPTVFYDKFCKGLLKTSPASLKAYLEHNLIAYRVGKKDEFGKFTGYYEPIFEGSFEKTPEFSVPLRGIPKNLVKVNLKDFGKEGYLIGKVKDGHLIPYDAREEIENEKEENVLLYMKNLPDKFILQIQGSGQIQTNKGLVRVGFSASNGLEFKGIGTIMQKEGVLEKGKASMPEIKKWLKKHPIKAEKLMNQNPRYIFFRFLSNEGGPLGTQGVPLTAKRSLAVDTRYIPLGSLLWLETKDGFHGKFNHLMIAQDTGSAIKGKIRGDVFWGTGKEAFAQAGRMNNKGQYFILLPRGVRLK
ncbi:MAG: MltA domain-containing protein [Alphaproteobacteria bacterium]|nr:MltA domain-containing protein [Alphaproteobacteria bacterium]